MNVSVQLFAFRESFTDTMDAWAEQSVPNNVSATYEAWVTPSCPNRAECGTWQQAAQHPVFEAREGPPGKLSSRNAAHDAALASGADAVVSCDADAPPTHDGVLRALTDALSAPSVVGVDGNPKAPPTVLGLTLNTVKAAVDTVVPYIHGRCSAFTTKGWQHAGPFNEGLDQTDINAVWMEEEFRFRRRLGEVGRVVKAREATVHNDTRRWECRLTAPWASFGRPVDSFCRRIGDQTFMPRHVQTDSYAADGPQPGPRRRMVGQRDDEGAADYAEDPSGNARQRRGR